jgi:DegV family protein with EDD domain
MSKIAFVTDSTAYIPENFCRELNITVLPQVLIWGDQTFRDGIDILPDEFYKRLETAKVMPSTSQVSAMAVQETFKSLVDQGYEVVAILISAKLSGTMQSALQALEEIGPAREKITVVDSNSTAMAMGFHVLTAARAAKDGASRQEAVAVAEKARDYTGIYFAVETLEFLHRGGRIGGAQRFIGTALNMKPVLALIDGRVEAVERIRTKTKALERVVELVVEQSKGKSPVHLATLHAHAEQEAKEVLERTAALVSPVESILTEISPVVGTHTGPGTIGLAYMAGM